MYNQYETNKMEYIKMAVDVVRYGMVGQDPQQWSSESHKIRVMLLGDDIVDNYNPEYNPNDIYQQLNQYENITCFNCAIKGNTMNSLLFGKPPLDIVKLHRPYAYPNNTNLINSCDRAHWIVLGIGFNESKDIPLELHKVQLNMILDLILKKNVQCITITDPAIWPEFSNMVKELCEQRQVFYVNSTNRGLANLIYETIRR